MKLAAHLLFRGGKPVLVTDLAWPSYQRILKQVASKANARIDWIQTLLGRWLRSKSTIIKINDNLFVHAGISRLFIDDGYNLEETNQHMRQSLFQDEKEYEKVWDSFYGKFYDEASPIWYRGYFDPDFKKSEINRILRKVDANHIVVGHTSFKQIVSLFDNKILAVDSGIKNGIYGELLLIKDDNYYRCTLEGERIKIN
jgi:hypothetical protein